MRRRSSAGSERTTYRRYLTRRRVRTVVDVHMAQSGGRTVQRRTKDRIRTVQEHDGVTAGDVERESAVKLDAFEGEIGCDACIREETRRLDHEPLIEMIHGHDRIGVVERVEDQRSSIAPDFVGLVAAGGAS